MCMEISCLNVWIDVCICRERKKSIGYIISNISNVFNVYICVGRYVCLEINMVVDVKC